MRVKPSQLVPGCMLVNDVTGKTGQPLITKDTVLTKETIQFLEKFLVNAVQVSTRLATGDVFIPREVADVDDKSSLTNTQVLEQKTDSIIDHYLTVVIEYKQMYNEWQNVLRIDMPKVRQLLIPLYERINEIGFDIFLLHKYSLKADYIYHHSVAVGFISTYLARKMGYTKGESLQIGLAGFLSDSGMIKLSHLITKKREPLTNTEWQEVKKHPIYSHHLVKDMRTLSEPAQIAISQHHERMDGSGYPFGLSGDKIHVYARIIAVCDMYHAMTSERVYQESLPPAQVIDFIETEQYSRLDPEVVQTFIRVLANHLIGKRVRLSDQRTGEIIFISESKNVTRPIIKLEKTGEIISLENNSAIFISEILGN